MNITRENIDNVNAVINIAIEKADYEKQVADVLKDYRQKASIPGFRPGKAPKGLIQKRFGTAVLVEEVNKLLSQNLSKFLVDEKLPILGEPLPNEEKQAPINWETDENFTFTFDVALAPEVNVSLDKDNKLKYYKIAVSDEMIQQQEEMAANQLGENVPAEEANETSSVRGNFVQVDAEGNDVEGGIAPEGVILAVDRIKDEEIKKSFVGCKKEDIIIFDPVKAFDNRHEVGHMLNIKHEEADELNSEFKFTVTEVLQFQKAELNEELFKKLYGEETEVKTIEDFRARIKEEIARSLVSSSEYKFAMDTRDSLVEQANLELPEAFLKRWLKEVNKELTEEQIDQDFDGFMKDLQWQLIKDSIAKEGEVKITPEEAEDFAKNIALAQYQQYGIYDVPEEQLESFAKMMLEKPEENERIYKKLHEDKVIAIVKEKVTVEEEEISQEEFTKMMQ
ncbi:trigger factor [Maribellus sp. CM-23]|uniref:trigger factor n=1 Tax=Maribellus sp. CM-23 TaxID=2781026 RepID=UPI001F39BC25|nr:trigger factor [Maribellus sp. CM-23]MCE4563639.1 trigger factor [Maribellus sp. CM-23]